MTVAKPGPAVFVKVAMANDLGADVPVVTEPVATLVDAGPNGQASNRRFDDLYLRHGQRLIGLVSRITGDRAVAEEVVQDAFFELVGQPVLQQPDESVAAWLRRVCLNRALNRRRDEERARAREDRAGRLDRVVPDGPSEVAIRRETQAEVRRVLDQLPERQRLTILLRHSGYSYAEIAATLEIAVGSVGVILARAERAFRERYLESNHDLP